MPAYYSSPSVWPVSVRQQLMAEIETAEKTLTQIDDSQAYARQAYRLSRIAFGKWDKVLDQAAHGPVWLKQPEIAQLVVESLHYRDNNEQELQRIRRYILQNPVQAGLVAHWDEWPWSYCKAFVP
jgi:hypothetical protein